MNDFQISLASNKECVREVINLLHPDILNDKKEKIKINFQYDWVCIKSSSISFGIRFECKLSSGNKSLDLFQKELKNNKFDVWRFYDDSKFKLEDDEKFNYLRILYKNALNDILNKYGIKKPTAQQMSDYYYSN